MEPASFSGGLVGLACSACRRTGQSEVPPRLQVDWSIQRTGACRRSGLASVQRCRRTGQSCVHRLRRTGQSCVHRLRRPGRSCVQRLQADWSIDRAALAGGLVGRACSAYRRTGRSSVQRLHADWSVESAAALAGGLASPAYRRLQAGWSGDRPALQADWSVVRASLAAAWPVVRAALAGGLVDRSCSACRRTGRWSVQRFQAD